MGKNDFTLVDEILKDVQDKNKLITKYMKDAINTKTTPLDEKKVAFIKNQGYDSFIAPIGGVSVVDYAKKKQSFSALNAIKKHLFK